MSRPAEIPVRGSDCPAWCPDVHHRGWKSHARNCGEVTVRDVVYSVDVVKYRDDEPVVVWFCVYRPDDPQAEYMLPADARSIYEALGRALALLDEDQAVTPAPVLSQPS
jgi:hypothetical protein